MNRFSSHAYLPPAEYFSPYLIQEDDDSICGLVNGVPTFFIPAQRVGRVLFSTLRASAGGLFVLEKAEVSMNTMIALANFLRFHDLGLSIRLPVLFSETISTVDFSPTIDFSSLKDLNSDLQEDGKTYLVDVNHVHLSSRRKRALRKAHDNGISVARTDVSEVDETWNFLVEGLSSRGLFFVSSARINTIVSDFPEHFELISAKNGNGAICGVALLNKSGRVLRIPNYFSERLLDGVTESLLLFAYNKAREMNLQYVDLGTSTSPSDGNEVLGIAKFKAEMGARQQPLYVQKISSV